MLPNWEVGPAAFSRSRGGTIRTAMTTSRLPSKTSRLPSKSIAKARLAGCGETAALRIPPAANATHGNGHSTGSVIESPIADERKCISPSCIQLRSARSDFRERSWISGVGDRPAVPSERALRLRLEGDYVDAALFPRVSCERQAAIFRRAREAGRLNGEFDGGQLMSSTDAARQRLRPKILNTRIFIDTTPKSVILSRHPASPRGAYRDRHGT